MGIVMGNENVTVLDHMQESIRMAVERQPTFLQGHVEVVRLGYNPGCAVGWNLGLRAMLSESSTQWALIPSSDVSFKKGMLERIVNHVANRQSHPAANTKEERII